MDSASSFFPCFSEEEFLNHNADTFMSQPEKTKDISSIAASLTKKCNEFITSTINMPPDNSMLPSLEKYLSLYVNRTQYMRYTINSLFQIRYTLQNHVVSIEKEIQDTMSLCNSVIEENERLKKMLNDRT